MHYFLQLHTLHASCRGFLGDSVVKSTPANAGGVGSIPELGRSPGGGNGNPLQPGESHGQRSLADTTERLSTQAGLVQPEASPGLMDSPWRIIFLYYSWRQRGRSSPQRGSPRLAPPWKSPAGLPKRWGLCYPKTVQSRVGCQAKSDPLQGHLGPPSSF